MKRYAVMVDTRGTRRLSDTKSGHKVYVIADRPDAVPMAFSLDFGATIVQKAIPFEQATAYELRRCERVLKPNNGGKCVLLSQVQMQLNEATMHNHFDREQVRAYGVQQ